MQTTSAGSNRTWDLMRPEVITGWTARLRPAFEVSRHTRIMNFDSTCGILTDLTLGKKEFGPESLVHHIFKGKWLNYQYYLVCCVLRILHVSIILHDVGLQI